MTKSDEADRCFMQRFTCSAAVFSAFSEDMGLDRDTAKKLPRLRGWDLKDRKFCGAVSGAIMVIGLKYGKTDMADGAATEKTRALLRQFIREFTEKNGPVSLTALLGYDLSNPKDYDDAKESGLFATKCPAPGAGCSGYS